MLQKINRLVKQKDFDNVLKYGQTAYNKIIGLKSIKNQQTDNRFGIIISSKISKKAVVRNTIRRQIREMLKLELNHLKTGYDIVIITLPVIVDKNNDLIFSALKYNFKKLNLYSAV